MNPAPEAIAHIAEVMSTFPSWWALCGGWAVDAWVGRQTRDHGDVDIAISHDDQRALFDHLTEWELVAHDRHVADDSAEPWDGRVLQLPAHIHGREPAAKGHRADRLREPAQAGFSLDIQLTEASGNHVLVSRDPRISVALSSYIKPSGWGVPALAPEVVLFYKAREGRLHDEEDPSALLPLLSLPQRDWLRGAISLVHPGHAWLRPLGRDDGSDTR